MPSGVVASRKRAYSPHAMAPVRFFSGPRNLERTGRRAGQFSRTLWGAFRSTLLLRAANRQQSKREASRRDIVRIARRFNAGVSRIESRVPKGRLNESQFTDLSRPFGTHEFRVQFPALKRRAILIHPFGIPIAWRRSPISVFHF